MREVVQPFDLVGAQLDAFGGSLVWWYFAVASAFQCVMAGLTRLEGDGIVTRIVYAEVPPKVENHLTN